MRTRRYKPTKQTYGVRDVVVLVVAQGDEQAVSNELDVLAHELRVHANKGHWESVRYAAPSLLGFTALIAAIMAMLYTPASTALVQPQLSFSGWEARTMQGNIYTQFANTDYIQDNCKTPITTKIDDEDDITNTCIQIEHASQAYHNYFRWMADWVTWAEAGNGTRTLDTRPKGFALLNDNTSITAPWMAENADLAFRTKSNETVSRL